VFTAPSDGATLTVTDAYLKGDTFQVLDNGNPIGTTSAVPPNSGNCGSDPAPCSTDPTVSHGVFTLGPGPHSITVKSIASPYSAGAAYFRIELKQEHMVCYRIKSEGTVRPHAVTTQDQFGTTRMEALGPELLCVPASRTELKPPK
jgi:hypothetical protein